MPGGKLILDGQISEEYGPGLSQSRLDFGRGCLVGEGRAMFYLHEMLSDSKPILKRILSSGLRLKGLQLYDDLVRSRDEFTKDDLAAVLAPLESELLLPDNESVGSSSSDPCIYERTSFDCLTLETSPEEDVCHSGGVWIISKKVAPLIPEQLRKTSIRIKSRNGKSLSFIGFEPEPEDSILQILLQEEPLKCMGCGSELIPFPTSFVIDPVDEPFSIQVDSSGFENHGRLHPLVFPVGDAMDWFDRFRDKIAFTRVRSSESDLVKLAKDLIALVTEK